MIQLTRLGGEPFILNAELIQYVEARPDTFITLTTGQRLVVAEAMDEVLRRTMVYQQAKHLLPPPHDARRTSYRAGPADPPGRVAAKETSYME
jgi:flagellar protein FlbD